MSEIDSLRPTPPPVRLGRAAFAMAAAIVLMTGLFITLVAVPTPGTRVEATPEPTAETYAAMSSIVAPSPSATLVASIVPSPAAPSLSATPVVSPSPVVVVGHVATRVRVPDLRIDLAVVAPPKDRDSYPKCGVAMYLAELLQPGEDGATYLYAHARAGMFLPIFERAIQKLHGGPKSMLGLSVEVFTSDDLRYLYAIEDVLVHQTTLGDAGTARTHELWLQTSEGPKGTKGKTQVRALPVGVEAAPHEQAHPVAKPVTCG